MIRSSQIFLNLLCTVSLSSAMTVYKTPMVASNSNSQSAYGGNGITQCQLPTSLQEIRSQNVLISAINEGNLDSVQATFDSWIMRFFNAQGRRKQLEVALNHAVTLPYQKSGSIVAYLVTKVQDCPLQEPKELLESALTNGHQSVIEHMKTYHPELLQTALMEAVKDHAKAQWFDTLNEAVVLTAGQKHELIAAAVKDAAQVIPFLRGFDKLLYLRARYQQSIEKVENEERERLAERVQMDDQATLTKNNDDNTLGRVVLCMSMCPLLLAPLIKGLEYLDAAQDVKPKAE